MDYLFVNNAFLLNQNTNIYGEYINPGTYDYTFNINLAALAPNMTSLFTNASYIQNTQDMNNYNINLVLPDSLTYPNWNANINNQNIITLEIGNSLTGFSTLNPSVPESFGERLLEVVAHKIFGHGKAHAAISNDSAFFTHDAELWNHLSSSVATDSFRHNIFNQYVALGRYENEIILNGPGIGNDKNVFVNFNFNGLSIDFPMYLAGNVLLNNGLTPTEISFFFNGPNTGGTILTNGVYNVPILIKMHT